MDSRVAGDTRCCDEGRRIDAVRYSAFFRSSVSVQLPSIPANIDLARALPTLKVVFGSLRGGRGAGRPEEKAIVACEFN